MTADIVSLKLFKARRHREQVVDQVVEWWECRVGICVVKVGVTQTALDAMEVFNAELRRRRDKPITKDEVMLCADHADKIVKHRW